jgi:hypothetical protein
MEFQIFTSVDHAAGKRLLANNQLEGDIPIIRNTIMFIE